MAILKHLPRHEYVKDADGKEVRREVTEWPTGAYCDLAYKPGRITGQRWASNPDDYVVLIKTHAGLCLFETERNGYHDSDFLMTVWDEAANRPRQIMFATTRGWTYPCYGSSPDATPEIRRKYERWSKAQQIKAQRRKERAKRDAAAKFRADCGVTAEQHERLQAALGGHDLARLAKLLTSGHAGRLRSEFRKSLYSQAREWLDSEAPEYRRPLSKNQLNYL